MQESETKCHNLAEKWQSDVLH